jgi:hypothetical protein
MINSFCGLFRYNNVIGSILESSFFLVAVSLILLSVTSFQLQLTASTLAASTNQPNATVGPTPPFTNNLQNSTNSPSVVRDINATTLAQKQELISSHIQQHQPSSIQIQQNQQTPQLYPPLAEQSQPPLSQSQQLPPQQQPLSQPQPPMQQQQTILPEGMRPVLLDNLKYSPTVLATLNLVLATLNLEEKLTLVVQTYNYCGNPPGGVLPGQDGEKCRQFLSLLDQTLINMLSLQ